MSRTRLDAAEVAAKLQTFIGTELEGQTADNVQIAIVVADTDDSTLVIMGTVDEALMPLLLIGAANTLTTTTN